MHSQNSNHQFSYQPEVNNLVGNVLEFSGQSSASEQIGRDVLQPAASADRPDPVSGPEVISKQITEEMVISRHITRMRAGRVAEVGGDGPAYHQEAA